MSTTWHLVYMILFSGMRLRCLRQFLRFGSYKLAATDLTVQAHTMHVYGGAQAGAHLLLLVLALWSNAIRQLVAAPRVYVPVHLLLPVITRLLLARPDTLVALDHLPVVQLDDAISRTNLPPNFGTLLAAAEYLHPHLEIIRQCRAASRRVS
jgi:hypothetical protein